MKRLLRLLACSRERVSPLGALGALLLPLGSLAAAGCAPKIGDKCVLSTDCSQQGTLVCDTSQPSGYCTQLNCTNGSCPNDAVCVEFQSSVPGCAYDDYQSPSRTGRSFCMAHCSSPSDCRQSDGYTCADPTLAPWSAAILDNNQAQSVCIVAPGLLADASPQPDAAVCMSYEIDAGPAVSSSDGGDASEPDAEGGATPDAQGTTDAAGTADAADAALDVERDSAPDAGFDATLDATPQDAGPVDAQGGG
jgi:hypothetical protein